MSFSFNIKTKYTLIFSGIACMLLSLFLTYKGILAYLIQKKLEDDFGGMGGTDTICLLYTSPSPRDATLSRMPSSA